MAEAMLEKSRGPLEEEDSDLEEVQEELDVGGAGDAGQPSTAAAPSTDANNNAIKGGTREAKLHEKKKERRKMQRKEKETARKVCPPKRMRKLPTLGDTSESESEDEGLAKARHKSALTIHRLLQNQLDVLVQMGVTVDKGEVQDLLRRLAHARNWRKRLLDAGLSDTRDGRSARELKRRLTLAASTTLKRLTLLEARCAPTEAEAKEELVNHLVGALLGKDANDVRATKDQTDEAIEKAQSIVGSVQAKLPELVNEALKEKEKEGGGAESTDPAAPGTSAAAAVAPETSVEAAGTSAAAAEAAGTSVSGAPGVVEGGKATPAALVAGLDSDMDLDED